ncbi:MAG TPA: MarR family transcriptional regulator [Pseudonocardiaceae bacterium]|nr:MarR family transcriptional regulator [Pseudonocardiaceae bacterium]
MQQTQSGSEEPVGAGDHVDRVLALWAGEAPQLDLATVGVIARLGRVRAYIDRQLDETLGEYGLTRQSWDVLASLRRVGPPYRLTPTDLYQAVMRTSGAITHTLHGLEHAGLVSREPNPDDKRSMHVRLTDAGRALTEEVAPEHLANEHRMLAPLNEAERNTLADLLRTLLIAFERDQPTPHAPTSASRPRPRPDQD